MNLVLAVCMIGCLCAAALVLLSPSQMRLLADWLNARADSLDWNALRFNEYKEERKKPKS